MRRIITASVVLVVLFYASDLPGDELRLRQFSRDILDRSRSARDEALSVARIRGLVIKGIDSNRREFSLQALGPDGIPVYYISENSIASTTTRTTEVRADIGGGSGFTIGIWDAGKVGITHVELLPRASWLDPLNPDLSDHATHVAGTLIGSGSVHTGAKGMACEASLACYANDDDIAEMAAEAAGGMTLSNHSYGHIQGWYKGDLHDDDINDWNWYWYGNTFISTTEDYRFGSYSDISAQVDSIACEAPDYLIVCSAGNHHGETIPAQGDSHYVWNQVYDYWEWSTAVRDIDGGLNGYDCLGDGWKTAKNSLTIGAVDDLIEYTGPDDVVLEDYSSRGPTDDGRIKPDLVGNGYDLHSIKGINSGHDDCSGTSQASANVTGSLALLQDWYMDNHAASPMTAASLKALAINTAREAGSYFGPDYRFGWGLLDTKAAYDLLVSDLDQGGTLVRKLTIDEGTPLAFHYRTTTSRPRAVICWNDPPGNDTGWALNPTIPQLVNDLELMLAHGTVFHYPWTLDPTDPDHWAVRGANNRDNVERVDIINADVGDHYTIWIWNNGSLAGGSQDVSLVVSGMKFITTWYVAEDGSADFETIQGALNLAAAGDTIIVHPGTYEEHGLVIDKQLVISAPNGPDLTTVDAQGIGRCFYIDSGAGGVEIEGFELANGYAGGSGTDGYGGAVYCASGTAKISDCRITGSEASIRGGGLYLTGGTPEISECAIEECSSASGGGIYAYYSDPSIHGADITDCSATGYGGGIYCYHSDANIEYCLFQADSAGTSGGGIGNYESSPTLLNCTVTGCHADSHGGGIYAGTNSYPILINTIAVFSTGGEGVYGTIGFSGATVTCCDVYGNAAGEYGGSISNQTGINGNISADPLFCDAGGSNFGLQGISPCLAANNSCAVQIGYLGQACHSRSLWYVNATGTGDAANIQAAIDSTFDGDTVLVAAGTYTGTGNRDIEFRGKSILVVSESGRASTIVDCQSASGDNHAGFLFTAGEDSTAILDGFTVTHASLCGVRSIYASPVIRDCSFVDNDEVQYSTGPGGGLWFEWGRPRVTGCEIVDNGGAEGRGGLYVLNAELFIENCAVTDNTGSFYGGFNFNSSATCSSTIRDCTISRNHSGGDGGAIRLMSDAYVTIEDCRIFDNTAQFTGGGIAAGGGITMTNTIVARNAVTGPAGAYGGGMFLGGTTSITDCTVVLNAAPNFGSGIFLCQHSPERPVTIVRTMVAFNHGSTGIYLDDSIGGSDVTLSCCDVYGNEAGNYGGDLSDQTGSNDNISEDPLLCDTLAGNFYIFDDSPCAPAHSPCGELIGCRVVACFEAPDLIITEFSVSDNLPDPGDSITFTVTVKNIGLSAADSFTIGWYRDRSVPPHPGLNSTRDTLVPGLAVGDSVVWTPTISSTQFSEWTSWFLADAGGDIREGDEENNDCGPIDIVWGIPLEPGWPVAGSGAFFGAPALANIDDDPLTLETVAGDAAGFLHVFCSDGSPLNGWPRDLGDSLLAAPAVGDVTGDWHPEIIVGCVDGYLYAVGQNGKPEWSVNTGTRISGAVTLADLDQDGLLEIVLTQYLPGTGVRVRIFEGDGTEWNTGWPFEYEDASGITEAAAGDVDDDGQIEIAFVTYGHTKPAPHSRVNLLRSDGSQYGAGWPAEIDTVVIAPPVIGEIVDGSTGLEIVVGALSGEVFVLNLSGAIWPSVPRMPGMIETSPSLVQADKDAGQEIAVVSRSWSEPIPPFGNWTGRVALIEGDGSFIPGWTKTTDSWHNDYGPVPSPISFGGTLAVAGPIYRIHSWWLEGAGEIEAFPIEYGAHIRASLAASDADGDGYFELTAPTIGDSLYCWELRGAWHDIDRSGWPMYRHDARRTGCWYIDPLTGEDDERETPAVTALAEIWPNPFNPSTSIRFSISYKTDVRIAVYDVSGRLVRTLRDGVMDAGYHAVQWNGLSDRGTSVASGVYFCRMSAGKTEETRKMVLLR